MKPAEKNKVMDAFATNEIQVLVSTTVVEVGVNVPNATVMMIENAERFGLAQLHQLRGRVGRGDAQSYCIMVDNIQSKESKKRLDILNRSNDGFFIACLLYTSISGIPYGWWGDQIYPIYRSDTATCQLWWKFSA